MKKNRFFKIKFWVITTLSILSIFIISIISIIIIKYQESKSYSISIPDALTLINLDPTFRTDAIRRDTINSILDQNFKSMNCQNIESFNFDSLKYCNMDYFIHYVEAKSKLGMASEILENKKIVDILNKTYHNYKPIYANNTGLHIHDNIFNHVMLAMVPLGMISEDEKDFWIVKYSSLELNDYEIKLPQVWNRIWMFRILGVNDVYSLIEDYDLNSSQTMKNVCGYIPPLSAYKYENYFRETSSHMLYKYFIVQSFCNVSMTPEDYDFLKSW